MKANVIKNLAVALLLTAATAAAPAQARDRHQHHRHHHHHHSDMNRVLGAIAVGTIITGIVRSSPQADPYRYPAPVRYRDPYTVCGVTPHYHGAWVDIVETNCNGEVVRITTRRR